MARPNIDLRIIHTQGHGAKADMRAAAQFINRSFPEAHVRAEQVGREFWVVAREGTTEEMLGRIKGFVKDWARRQGIPFSVTNFLDDGSPFLDLPADLDFPSLPPAEMHTGPYLVQVATWLDGKGIEEREPDQLAEKSVATWEECHTFVRKAKSAIDRFGGNSASRVRIVRRPN